MGSNNIRIGICTEKEMGEATIIMALQVTILCTGFEMSGAFKVSHLFGDPDTE